MIRAAVLRTTNQPLSIEEIEVDDPKAGEVRIRLSAAGLCHSDVALIEGLFPITLPAVPGHEGSGIVESVGEGVTRVVPGDHVILSPIPQCGECFWCRRGQPTQCEVRMLAPVVGGLLDGTTRLRSAAGESLSQFCFSGTFSEVTVAPEMSVVKIPAGSNMVAAALVGCAVTTGVGAARNTADIQPGDTVAVIGCGGVGLNVVQGAKLAGAGQIVAIDVVDLKLDLARRLGATHTVNATKDDVVDAVRKLTGGHGADVSFDVTGLATSVTQMSDMTRRGGEMVLIGVGQPESALATRPIQTSGKTLKGCCFGGAKVDEEFPRLVQEYEDGLLDIDTLISQRISLDDINAGFDDMEGGRVARSVIVYD